MDLMANTLGLAAFHSSFEWTYKLKGKTVNVKLTAAAGPDLQNRLATLPQAQILLNRLERLSHKALAVQAKQAERQTRDESRWSRRFAI